jgi:hypothetical protein
MTVSKGIETKKLVTSLTPNRANPWTIPTLASQAGRVESTKHFASNPGSTRIAIGSTGKHAPEASGHANEVRDVECLLRGSESSRKADHQKYRPAPLGRARFARIDAYVPTPNKINPQSGRSARQRNPMLD